MVQGDEVFNTYGELGNLHLLHMYGFSEAFPDNHYDVVSYECAASTRVFSFCT